ncbi:hypothetical protein EOK75_18835 (plasmid) [Pseudorhodobacter turbinis]|uniref:H+/citrate symporter n=1 Tax=Pseudorhodobacter turbinis TaxID=2500533 RepID=A0A4V1E1D4_9RHOB|nr:hypothetical protein [Pseudorhodobacter turbinis]QCO57744.1 hypothetical protein EOK75_18835 [Pseudorhodobacter turbinis]
MPSTTARLVTLQRALLLGVMTSALVLIFVPSQVVTSLGVGMLLGFLALSCRQFRFGTWVPVLMSLCAAVAAMVTHVAADVLWHAVDRMLFLAALIAMLGTLRSAAALAPEVRQAGEFVTNQPASRRYLAMTFGGHLFGVLINFGGLALLLDIAKQSMDRDAASNIPPEVKEARVRRMTLAVIRGFSLISLWSPFGFATNAILIAVPGISYVQFGPIGLAMSFVLMAIGWALDRHEGRQFRNLGLQTPSPPPRSWMGAVLLLGHVLILGAAVFISHAVTPLSFQQALIVIVPCYAVLWAAAATRRDPKGAMGGVGEAARASWLRLSNMGPEVGVFASAGFLAVVFLALIPTEALRETIIHWGLSPVSYALGLSLSVFALAMVGVNPIISASILGAIAAQLAMPGLSNTAIALAITGGWAAVIGLSPFISTLAITSAIIGRRPEQIGPVWNGRYCISVLLVWLVFLAGLMLSGMI